MFADLLEQASKAEGLEKAASLAAFAASELTLSQNRILKPLNPILGETYELIDNEAKFRFLAEQVCHHPPVSAFTVESEHYTVTGDTRCKSSFSMWKGAMEIEFKAPVMVDMGGSYFSVGKPLMFFKGLVFGTPHFDFQGEVKIVDFNEIFEFDTTLCFYEEDDEYKGIGNFDGAIRQNNKVKGVLLGNWTKGMVLLETSDQRLAKKLDISKLLSNFEAESEKLPCKAKIIWRVKSEPFMNSFNPSDYKLSSYASRLNDLSEKLALVLPPTDSRFRPDNRLYENGNIDEAQKNKDLIEQIQRDHKKEMNEKKQVYKPIYFSEENEQFKYNGNYWETREKGDWSQSRDIFNLK